MIGAFTWKIDQLVANPAVCWVFATPRHADVVTVLDEATVKQQDFDSPRRDQLIEAIGPSP